MIGACRGSLRGGPCEPNSAKNRYKLDVRVNLFAAHRKNHTQRFLFTAEVRGRHSYRTCQPPSQIISVKDFTFMPTSSLGTNSPALQTRPCCLRPEKQAPAPSPSISSSYSQLQLPLAVGALKTPHCAKFCATPPPSIADMTLIAPRSHTPREFA